MHIETRKNTTEHFGSYLFMGTVISTDPGTIAIEVVPDGQGNLKRLQGIPLAATFAHALGFKDPILPNVGSRVLCCSGYSGFCLIIGIVPPMEVQGSETEASMPCRAAFGTDEPLTDEVHAAGYYGALAKAAILNNQLPVDVVQGEKVIANEFGVLLGLFQMMAVLKGSELAQVQCHFLDDLVRVISHNFQHYTALGEHNIFHDGKGLHLEVGLTHDPKESLGVPQGNTGNDKATLKDTATRDQEKNVEFYQLDDERLKAIERLKVFVGKLGDFINIMLTAPTNEQRKLDGSIPEKPDRGLLQFHAGLDGLLVVRSVKGIILEKTNWIRVPHRIRTPEDPEGDNGKDINYKLREAFSFDESYTDSGTPFLYYLQLRDYLAYVEEDLNYSNFKIHEKDFSVNDDHKREMPLEDLTFVDPITGTSFTKKRSLIALMPNGGVSMMDAWGSAMIMEGGNIYTQPAKDYVIQPMRNFVVKAGGAIALTAKKELDLSSTEGGLRIKTDKAQYLYSDNSGIILHSNGNGVSEGFAPYDTEEPVTYASGIILSAPKSGVTSYGQQIYSKATENMVFSAKELTAETDVMLELVSKQVASVYSNSMIVASKQVTEIYSRGSVVLVGNQSTVISKKNQTFGVTGGPIPLPVQGLMDAVDKNKDFFTVLDGVVDSKSELTPADRLSFFKDDENLQKLKFYFLPSAQYGLTDSDVLPQTVAQLEEFTFPGIHKLEKWVEKPVNDSYPYPGADQAMSFVTTSMQNIEQTDSELINKAKDLVTSTKLADAQNVFENYLVSL